MGNTVFKAALMSFILIAAILNYGCIKCYSETKSGETYSNLVDNNINSQYYQQTVARFIFDIVFIENFENKCSKYETTNKLKIINNTDSLISFNYTVNSYNTAHEVIFTSTDFVVIQPNDTADKGVININNKFLEYGALDYEVTSDAIIYN